MDHPLDGRQGRLPNRLRKRTLTQQWMADPEMGGELQKRHAHHQVSVTLFCSARSHTCPYRRKKRRRSSISVPNSTHSCLVVAIGRGDRASHHNADTTEGFLFKRHLRWHTLSLSLLQNKGLCFIPSLCRKPRKRCPKLMQLRSVHRRTHTFLQKTTKTHHPLAKDASWHLRYS